MPKPRRSAAARQIAILRRSVRALSGSLSRLAPTLRALEKAAKEAKTQQAAPRKLKLTAERRAALKLQGQYMGHVRKLSRKNKAKVKAVRAQKGLRRALALAKRLAKG